MFDSIKVGRRLAATEERGLQMEPRFSEIAERWEAWWQGTADRPLLIGTAPMGPDAVRRKPFDLIDRPDAWLEHERRRLLATYFVDQTVPHIRVDFGPVLTGAFLGAELEFAAAENTSWQRPVTSVYEDTPAIDPQNRWLQSCLTLTDATAADAAGNYLVSLPDLSGAPDILANLRGSEALLMDLYDHPERVDAIMPPLVDAWEYGFDQIMERIVRAGAGATSWLYAWSRVPYTVPTCDFNAMIGPDHFARFALPFLEEQGRRAGRCLFHLDGYDAARHARALADSSIEAVQFTPGAGSPGAVPKIPMFQMLQEAGKSVVVICAAEEVPELISKLSPGATTLFVEEIKDRKAAEELESLVRSGA
jgi:hypothetical protein